MATTTRISARISSETYAEIEAHVKQTGVAKGFLIEEALRHHLQALREIPEDVMIPARLVVTTESLEMIAEASTRDGPPTEALRALLSG